MNLLKNKEEEEMQMFGQLHTIAAAASQPIVLATSYTNAITSLKGVLITLGSAIGAVMLVYGGIKFAMAFRQMDQQGEHQAVYSVVAGGVLLGLSALVTALT